MSDARSTLLEAVITELDRSGIRDRSLRDIALAVGSSHRMLIHHFGSREALFVAVVDAVEQGERDRTHALDLETIPDPVDAFRAIWRGLAQPRQAGRERLFFECYARGLQGEAPFDRLLPAAVDSWLTMVTDLNVAAGMPRPAARAHARMTLAVVRGMLLDLLATGDRRGCAAAIDLFAKATIGPSRRS
jgi:AcrR family transcriptional regulator